MANLDRYEMPPVPPAGMFDARFASQRFAESAPESGGPGEEYRVTLNSARYPLHVHSSHSTTTDLYLVLEEVESGKVIATHDLQDGKVVTVGKLAENGFVLRVQHEQRRNTSIIFYRT